MFAPLILLIKYLSGLVFEMFPTCQSLNFKFKTQNSLKLQMAFNSNRMHRMLSYNCKTFQIGNLGCYKPTHLKMNLALEIRVG